MVKVKRATKKKAVQTPVKDLRFKFARKPGKNGKGVWENLTLLFERNEKEKRSDQELGEEMISIHPDVDPKFFSPTWIQTRRTLYNRGQLFVTKEPPKIQSQRYAILSDRPKAKAKAKAKAKSKD